MADTTASIKLDLDNEAFIKKMKESLGVMGEVGKAESLSGAVNMFLKIGAVVGVAAAAVAAFKIGLDAVVEGERLMALDNTFRALASNIGLSADKLKNELTKATKEFVSEAELMQMANRAMIELGDQAGRIPSLMKLAGKATAIFGGDLKDNFEAFSNLIATGNSRLLRQYGIHVDATKVVKEYARAHGMAVDVLSDEAKKTAVVEAGMRDLESRLEKIPKSQKPATDAVKQFKAAWTEVWDTINKIASGSGSLFKDFIDGATTVAKTLKSAMGSTKESFSEVDTKLNAVTAQIEKQQKVVKGISDRMKEAGTIANLFNESNLATQKKKLAALMAEAGELTHKHSLLKAEADQEKKTLEAAQDANEKKLEIRKELGNKTAADMDKLKAKELEFNRDLIAIQKDLIAARAQNDITAEDANRTFNAERVIIEQEHVEKLLEIAKKYSENKFLDSENYAKMLEDAELTKNERIAAMEYDLQNKRIAAMERAAQRAKTLSDGIQAGFALEGARATKEFNDMGARGQRAFGVIKENAASAFIEMGKGTRSAGEAMRMFMFGAIADIAEAEGKLLLAKGIGTYNPVAIAQGGALLALSGLLRSMAGGAAKGVGGAEGGAGAGIGAGTTPETTKPEIQEQQKKAVTIQIQGNYYETEQTRTRLMEMIRESGDFTDFNLRQIGK